MTYGYVRVSTRGQAENGNSLQAQREAVEARGAQSNLIFEDVFTGGKCDRPRLNELLKSIGKGDTLIVTKLDRIARNLVEGVQLIDELISRGVVIDVLNMGTFDNRPANRLQLQVLLAVAEFEKETIKERMLEGKAIARQNPDYSEGRPPKWTRKQYTHAMELLTKHSYKEVSDLTGIPVSTLKLESRKRREAAVV